MTLQLVTYERNGGPLETPQVDRNWLDIEDRFKDLQGGAGVESWEKDPTTGGLVIHFTDNKTVGPISFPPAKLVHEGEYTPGKVYDENDIFTHEGSSYLVLTVFQARTWAQDQGSSAFGLLAASSTGLVDAFKDWPLDDVVYGIKNRQRVALDLAGSGGGPGLSSVTWDFMPPRDTFDGDVIGFFRPPVALRYSYVLPVSGINFGEIDVDYDLEVRRHATGSLVTTVRCTSSSVGEVGVPDFTGIAKDELLVVIARVPGSAQPFRIHTGLSVIFSKAEETA